MNAREKHGLQNNAAGPSEPPRLPGLVECVPDVQVGVHLAMRREHLTLR